MSDGAAGVLVTRPPRQAASLVARLEARGLRVLAVPTVAIEAIDQPALRRRVDEVLPGAERIVFVSPNAVARGFALFDSVGVTIPPGCRPAAVGEGSAHALREAGCRSVDAPIEGAGARALLAAPAFANVAGERVVIVRGEGGLGNLAPALRERGARVEELAVYRRVRPPIDLREVAAGWQAGWLRVTIVTSGTGLRNLHDAARGAARSALLATRLVTVSERIAGAAGVLGFIHAPVVARDPGEEAITEAVVRALADTGTGT